MQRVLLDLSNELLELIVDNLPLRKDRRALWRVSRRFRELLTRRVFDTITIRAKEDDLARLDRRPYGSLDATRPLDCLKSVKHLYLKAPFHKELGDHRCPHLATTSLSPNNKFAPLLMMIPCLLQLQVDSLTSFSWDLGTCIPEQILGPEGYLTKKQSAIESLSLITGTACPRFGFLGIRTEAVVLSSFSKLRNFSWKGLHWTQELDSLRGLFAKNHGVLEALELDFMSWQDVVIDGVRVRRGRPDRSPSFTEKILPHKTNGVVRQFKSLKSLALSAFEFEEATRQISRAFNIINLRSLKLHSCPGILTFLSTIVDAGLVLRLKSLELIMQDEAVERDGSLESPLISFLQSFQGLEHFHLMLRTELMRPVHWPSCYWNAISHHSATLKGLIYHERCQIVDIDRNDPNVFHWQDSQLWMSDFNLTQAETNRSCEVHFYNSALSKMQLDYFGIADEPWRVFYVMQRPLAIKQNFKLLHFRRTGTDRQRVLADEPRFEDEIRHLLDHDPGTWSQDYYNRFLEKERGITGGSVFGMAMVIFQSPQFENLQILAFGDFSHGGRYKGRYLLLCRAVTLVPEIKFRLMLRDDVESYKQYGLLNLEFLAACPREGLLWRSMGADYR